MPCIRCLIQLGLTRRYSPFWFSIDWSQRVIPGLSPTLTYLSSRPRLKKKNGIPMVTLGLAVDPLFDCQWNNLKRKEFPPLFLCVCAMSWQFRSMLLWRSGKNRADIDGRDVPCFFRSFELLKFKLFMRLCLKKIYLPLFLPVISSTSKPPSLNTVSWEK